MNRFGKVVSDIVDSIYRSGPVDVPHPEEAPDPNQTTANTDPGQVILRWLEERKVPRDNWDYFLNAIALEVYDVWPAEKVAAGLNPQTPAMTWQEGNKRHLACLAKWLNPGVIAHEEAHNSYALLSDQQMNDFGAVYTPMIKTDPLIKLLYSKNTYGLTSVVEGHAEVYRYIGEKMPESLKQYYPKLF
jgi:hypothetical protein